MVTATDKIVLFFAEDEHKNAQWLEQELNAPSVEIEVLSIMLPTKGLAGIAASAGKTIFILSPALLAVDDILEVMNEAKKHGKFLPVIYSEHVRMPPIFADKRFFNLSSANAKRHRELRSLVKALNK